MLFRVPYLGVNTALMASFRMLFPAPHRQSARYGAIHPDRFTRKESGGDGDHVDRCLHRYVDAITAVGHLEDGLGVLGVLVRIVDHAATACALHNLQTTQTIAVVDKSGPKTDVLPLVPCRAATVSDRMRRPCPLLALSGHRSLYRTCPLSGVKRTSRVIQSTVNHWR